MNENVLAMYIRRHVKGCLHDLVLLISRANIFLLCRHLGNDTHQKFFYYMRQETLLYVYGHESNEHNTFMVENF